MSHDVEKEDDVGKEDDVEKEEKIPAVFCPKCGGTAVECDCENGLVLAEMPKQKKPILDLVEISVLKEVAKSPGFCAVEIAARMGLSVKSVVDAFVVLKGKGFIQGTRIHENN